MKQNRRNKTNLLLAVLLIAVFGACSRQPENQYRLIVPTENDAANWNYWYWMHGAVSKDGITADLEAMNAAGFGGTYLFAIRDTVAGLYADKVVTMSSEWWELVRFAASEANRLGLEMGFNSCDGFTCAGGPWITPNKSMQKVVWTDTLVAGGSTFSGKLPQPEMVKGYYEDIATFAYPAPEGAGQNSWTIKPVVTSNLSNESLQYLAARENTRQFSTNEKGWVQFTFDEPFTCRSVQIKTGWNNYQSNRLIIETSDDGIHFKTHTRLVPPRSGWLDLDQPNTQLIEPVTARYFRFVFDPEGSEPGAEDLDDAKWSPTLRVKGIALSSEAKIHQFEGKNGSIWRVAAWSDEQALPDADCVDMKQLINLTQFVAADGTLNWQAPSGNWMILRMGHTSTGHENYIGGGGKGLECDKFDPAIVRFQFDQWFGEAYRQIGEELTAKVFTRFHVDSWECGSQNWSTVFPDEFEKRRGYDLMPYLPVMAGVPLRNAETSERVLQDVRETIAELFADNFYQTLHEESKKKGVLFSAESTAPVGVTDGLLHFKYVDLPMGEYWLRSPSHDKPNDILDAVSGAHIYGHPIVQAESFTEIRLDWDEDPALLKPLADRNFALGINKVVTHVFTHNPWPDREPGMTLDKVGTYLQRDQVWWPQSHAFWSYLRNCQLLLQQGKPVVDIAVFTGEETPRRAVLPDRLVDFLPGPMGADRVKTETNRLKNEGIPTRHLPRGVTTQTNMADPENWIDPLNGYAYDSFNKDVLLNRAAVKNGRVTLPGGASYAMLVIPGNRRLAPHGGGQMSLAVARKLAGLIKQGATVLWMESPLQTIGLRPDEDEPLKQLMADLSDGEKFSFKDEKGNSFEGIRKGKGRLMFGPYQSGSFKPLGLNEDFIASTEYGRLKGTLAWNHRLAGQKDIYFISNQSAEKLSVEMSFRLEGKVPVLYDAVSGQIRPCTAWNSKDNRTSLSYDFEPNESLFVLFDPANEDVRTGKSNTIQLKEILTIEGPWTVTFDPERGGPAEAQQWTELQDWSQSTIDGIRYYSGVATYKTGFEWQPAEHESEVWIDLGDFKHVAEVRLNGKTVGVCWTFPHRLRLDGQLKNGENLLEIDLANTWHNRLIGDHDLPKEQQITRTTAPYRLEGRPLLPAGVFGPVRLQRQK
ncbi:glycosyl hydrolase [Gaoshiqia sp. Z1-71]|uniref:glycosyl hydrolase n=1 Tax=Gaoshiqia hydrogeniformans TaxID=3290090 RepID=UPI003BF87F79